MYLYDTISIVTLQTSLHTVQVFRLLCNVNNTYRIIQIHQSVHTYLCLIQPTPSRKLIVVPVTTSEICGYRSQRKKEEDVVVKLFINGS